MTQHNLYQQVIMKHYRNPSGFKTIDQATHTGERSNSSCGDHFMLALNIKNETIAQLGFEGTGCSISVAACSIMTETICGKTIQEAKPLIQSTIKALKSKEKMDERTWGELAAFNGIKRYQARIPCALLPWELAQSILP